MILVPEDLVELYTRITYYNQLTVFHSYFIFIYYIYKKYIILYLQITFNGFIIVFHMKFLWSYSSSS